MKNLLAFMAALLLLPLLPILPLIVTLTKAFLDWWYDSAPIYWDNGIKRHQYEDYKAYVNSATWKKKREKRLKLDGYRCQHCGATARLEVHHYKYPEIKNII